MRFGLEGEFNVIEKIILVESLFIVFVWLLLVVIMSGVFLVWFVEFIFFFFDNRSWRYFIWLLNVVVWIGVLWLEMKYDVLEDIVGFY